MKKMLVLTLVLVFALSGLALAADSNEGDIKQIGVWNVSSIDQEGDNNLAKVKQVGDFNGAYVYQNDFQSLNKVETQVDQAGEFNQAFVWQYNSKENNMERNRKVNVVQSGEHNTAFVVQANGGPSTAWVNQSGVKNQANQWQSHELSHKWEHAQITQTGIANTALQTQLGVDSPLWMDIKQTGEHNVAIEFQNRPTASKNTARITQTGNFNFGIVTQ